MTKTKKNTTVVSTKTNTIVNIERDMSMEQIKFDLQRAKLRQVTLFKIGSLATLSVTRMGPNSFQVPGKVVEMLTLTETVQKLYNMSREIML